MNDKVKKGMIIAGCVVCCVILAAVSYTHLLRHLGVFTIWAVI